MEEIFSLNGRGVSVVRLVKPGAENTAAVRAAGRVTEILAKPRLARIKGVRR